MSNQCEKCGREKEFTGIVLTSLPPINVMRCRVCEPSAFYGSSSAVNDFRGYRGISIGGGIKDEPEKIEWNGEGLPPVGCECEVSVDGGNTWCTYKALNENNGMRLVEIANFTEDFQSNNFTFRPLRSEEDKKREAALHAIYVAIVSAERVHNRSDEADKVYEAIAAGKIPGVKLED